jgi:hypothetical protein
MLEWLRRWIMAWAAVKQARALEQMAKSREPKRY